MYPAVLNCVGVGFTAYIMCIFIYTILNTYILRKTKKVWYLTDFIKINKNHHIACLKKVDKNIKVK